MAVDFKVDVNRTSEYRILPENIKIMPALNGRHDLPDIEWLIQDILKQGQHTPVSIRSDGGQPVLVTGFSRWRAVSEINKRKLTPVPIQLRCTYVRCSEVEGFMANISENRFRNSTTMLDDAHNMHRLVKKYAMTEEQVAELYFPVTKTDEDRKNALRFVKKRLALIALTPEAEKAVLEGRMKESAAVQIAKLSEEQQRKVIKQNAQGRIKGKHIAQASTATGKASKPGLKDICRELQIVIDTGQFNGIGNKVCEASDDLIEFLSRVMGFEAPTIHSAEKKDQARV